MMEFRLAFSQAHEDPMHHINASGCFNCMCFESYDYERMANIGLDPSTTHTLQNQLSIAGCGQGQEIASFAAGRKLR